MKKVTPTIFIGLLLFQWVSALLDDTADPSVLIGLAFFLCLFLFMTYFVGWELADEVFDDGDTLVFKRGDKEERIPLTNIISVDYPKTTPGQAPLTLKLGTPGVFGGSVSFIPQAPYSLNPLGKNPTAEDLIMRVENAHSNRSW